MRYTFFDISDLIYLTANPDSRRADFTINSEIVFWSSQLPLEPNPNHRFGFLIEGNPDDENISFRLLAEHSCEFGKEEVLKLLRKQLPMFFKYDPAMLYYVEMGRFISPSVNFNGINALFFSSHQGKREWFNRLGVDSEPLYEEAEFDPAELKALEDQSLTPPKRVIAYLDIDFTLLALVLSRIFKQTVLNDSVIRVMENLKTQYPSVIWRIITSRPPERKAKLETSVTSVQAELLRRGFHVEQVIYMGERQGDGTILRKGPKIQEIKKDIQPGDLILFLDDSRSETIQAHCEVDDIQEMGAYLYPLRVHRKGNFPVSVVGLLQTYMLPLPSGEEKEIEVEEEQLEVAIEPEEEPKKEYPKSHSVSAAIRSGVGVFDPPSAKRRKVPQAGANSSQEESKDQVRTSSPGS